MNKEFITSTPEETKTIARNLANGIAPKTIIVLSGEMGAGKTHFVQGFAEAFRCEDQVSSPTFAIINEYAGRRGDIEQIIFHFDFYRINNLRELQNIGLEQYLYSDGICIIEWGELFLNELPPHQKVIIEILSETKRKITTIGI